jgi:membrane-bound serine protease (ClpP class)
MDFYVTLAEAAAAEPSKLLSPQAAIAGAVILLIGGIIFFFCEAMVPSFGALTACGMACIVGSCVCAFAYSRGLGWTFVVLNLVSIPVTVAFAFRMLPRSPLVINTQIQSAGEERETKARPDAAELAALVGKTGVALTRLNPGGTARIEGRKYDVVSDGDFIEPNTPIIVADVEGHHIEVRPQRS